MRFAQTLGLVLLPTLVWAQGSTGYDYRLSSEHASGSLVFRAGNPPSARIEVAGVVQADGPLRADPSGWVMTHSPPALDGIVDRLPLLEVQTPGKPVVIDWVLCGDPGSRLFEVRLRHDGKVIGRYHARLQLSPPPLSTRRGPIDAPLGSAGPPVDLTKLVRNRWWSRGTVGMWGLLRGVWDGIRGRDGSHFAQGTTPEQVARLHADLLRQPRPWSMLTIFQTARRQTRSDDDALALCVGWALVHHEAPVRPMRGLPPGESLDDKTLHFFVSAIMARRSNSSGSLSVGVLKELKDELPGGSGYNQRDITADTWGAVFGEALLLGKQLDP